MSVGLLFYAVGRYVSFVSFGASYVRLQYDSSAH